MKKGNLISFIRSFNVSLANLSRNLGSTHYSTAGSTDYDHMKNSLNQTHQTQTSVLPQHRILARGTYITE